MKEQFEKVLKELNQLGNQVFTGEIDRDVSDSFYFRFNSTHMHVVVEIDQSFGDFKFTYNFYCKSEPYISIGNSDMKVGYDEIKTAIKNVIDEHNKILSEM